MNWHNISSHQNTLALTAPTLVLRKRHFKFLDTVFSSFLVHFHREKTWKCVASSRLNMLNMKSFVMIENLENVLL